MPPPNSSSPGMHPHAGARCQLEFERKVCLTPSDLGGRHVFRPTLPDNYIDYHLELPSPMPFGLQSPIEMV